MLIFMHRAGYKDLVSSKVEPNLAQGQHEIHEKMGSSGIPSVLGGRTRRTTEGQARQRVTVRSGGYHFSLVSFATGPLRIGTNRCQD